MRIELHRKSIRIISESPQDAAFIEDSLGLKNNGDFIELKRKNKTACVPPGLLKTTESMEYLEAECNKHIDRCICKTE